MGLPALVKSFPKILFSSLLPFSLWAYWYLIRYVSAIQSYSTGSLFMAKTPEKPILICHLREMPHRRSSKSTQINSRLADQLLSPHLMVHAVTAASFVGSALTPIVLKAPADCQEVNEWDNGAILQSISDLWICVNESKRERCTITSQHHSN